LEKAFSFPALLGLGGSFNPPHMGHLSMMVRAKEVNQSHLLLGCSAKK
jgi:nicotinic acid mononucleotide adenylyltransferase